MAVQQLCAAEVSPVGEMPLERVEAEICSLAGQLAAGTCRYLLLLADFDERQGWQGWNVRSCAYWLSWRCGVDLRTAREHLRVARRLAELPYLAEKFSAGRLSYSKARAIARVATSHNEVALVRNDQNLWMCSGCGRVWGAPSRGMIEESAGSDQGPR